MSARVLVTGFEPYGGMPSNPAFDAMTALDGDAINGFDIIGKSLPVSIARIGNVLTELIDEVAPSAVICLGLYPGESAIRIERVGLNLADFRLADNEGVQMSDAPVSGNGPTARWSTLPVRAIEQALLQAGIPVHMSQTAGTYLCNACLYHALMLAKDHMPCGFLHLPMTPELVAGRLMSDAATAFEREPPPSMELERIIRAVRIAIEVTLSSGSLTAAQA